MTDELRALMQSSLGSAYALERELGGGGMSRVFLAEEVALGRKVVIKVLAPELAEGLSVDRFAREIRLAARLQHPNIVPLLSAGSAEGLPWYTMPFVRGDSLRVRMAVGTLESRAALRVLADVARALAYAHDAGVVHRDIKPENVLLSGGVAVVSDFGIAKAVDAARALVKGSTLTQLGAAIGTPAYMAPEQAVGGSDIDHRADLYALGIMAYELLSGQHPFADRRDVQQLVVAHLTQMPPPLDAAAAGIPASVSAIVMRCLAKDPADRPSTASAVLAVLESAPPVRRGDRTAPPVPVLEPNIAAVAVLPFVNLSSDPENEYLSDGITDEILGTLGRSRSIRVAGRASCFALKGQRLDPRTVGEKLNVTAVVEGSVRRMGNRVRVSAELLNAGDGFQVWSERYDRDVTDVFALQDEIAQAISGALTERLTTPITPVAITQSPVDGEAYRVYLQAMHLIRNQQSMKAFERGMALVDQSIALDPSLARAHLARATAYQGLAVYGFGAPSAVWHQARASARAAIALDDGLAEAWAIDAYASYYIDRSWEQAEAGLERALRADPDDPLTLVRAASMLLLRMPDRAEQMFHRAVAADPLSAWVGGAAASGLRYLRRDADAVAMARRALELNPNYLMSLLTLAKLLIQLGVPEEALELTEQATTLTPRSANPASALCTALVACGQRQRAREVRDEILTWHSAERPICTWIGICCVALGDIDDAFHWLESAVEGREFWVPWITVDPTMDPLRSDPRFDVLVGRIGIPRQEHGRE